MTADHALPRDGLRKLWRFFTIYGAGRTVFKAAGRLRMRPPALTLRRPQADIGLVGCGQFGFATIGYFLQQAFGPRVAACHDIDDQAARTLARALRVRRVCVSVAELLATPGLHTVYIASNHASHTAYAAQALAQGLNVYVEKPIAVTHEQLVELLTARQASSGALYAGYNRPFSGAVRWLRERIDIHRGSGITLQCFVSGHQLAPDHWYRRPEEGTRVCGNIGHWLDLLVHVLAWRGLPDQLAVSLTCADDAEPDDNLNISIASDRGDLFSITLTSRNEPFEGIREVIHFQHGNSTAEIEDFRRITLWQGAKRHRRRFWPKDVGHRLAILQPFADGHTRDWHEVELSTLLMLHVTGMVQQGQRQAAFSFAQAWQQLQQNLSHA